MTKFRSCQTSHVSGKSPTCHVVKMEYQQFSRHNIKNDKINLKSGVKFTYIHYVGDSWSKLNNRSQKLLHVQYYTRKLAIATGSPVKFNLMFNFQVQGQVPDNIKVIYSNSGVRYISHLYFRPCKEKDRRNFTKMLDSTGKTRTTRLTCALENMVY